jgi:hypothetical protein
MTDENGGCDVHNVSGSSIGSSLGRGANPQRLKQHKEPQDILRLK